MNQIFLDIKNELNKIIDELESSVSSDEALNYAKRHWAFPGITKAELITETKNLISLIDDKGNDEVDDEDETLARYLRALEFLRAHTVPQIWGNANEAVPAYIITINALKTALEPFLIKDDGKELAVQLKNQRKRVRSLEATLNDLEPKTSSLKEMVSSIEQAHETAEQLPTDLASLKEARKTIGELVTESTADKAATLAAKTEIEKLQEELKDASKEAKDILKECKSTYAAATSVGLAAAFSERSDSLSTSMWIWVAGLILSLGAGGYFGSAQLQKLLELMAQKDISNLSMSINFIMAILSIGAPVWFSWLATKQIGQRFKLSEDYAFKASVSRAYEGFRRESARFDKEMEAKLLSSALTRLDELPLRLVETENHGSPWHELASSNIVKQAMSKIPSFPDKVKELAGNAMSERQESIKANQIKNKSAPRKNDDSSDEDDV
ncbi:hypothetical protein P7L91_05320 [Bisgaard Taxon 10/6]|uniref:hypothetical protein n=1 Tax=Exercitatus varius TaxID=67857 RepID=UPI00294ACD76|nr:hypothetical protein [Exercitatus varius]MDG2960267.1 hypothetical protein [Exercitatus varius]